MNFDVNLHLCSLISHTKSTIQAEDAFAIRPTYQDSSMLH